MPEGQSQPRRQGKHSDRKHRDYDGRAERADGQARGPRIKRHEI